MDRGANWVGTLGAQGSSPIKHVGTGLPFPMFLFSSFLLFFCSPFLLFLYSSFSFSSFPPFSSFPLFFFSLLFFSPFPNRCPEPHQYLKANGAPGHGCRRLPPSHWYRSLTSTPLRSWNSCMYVSDFGHKRNFLVNVPKFNYISEFFRKNSRYFM